MILSDIYGYWFQEMSVTLVDLYSITDVIKW